MSKSPRSTAFNPRSKTRVNIYILVALATLALSIAFSIPPILLMESVVSDTTIVRLSNIGQAYGVVSAILSAVALVALAASILYQAKQQRNDRMLAWRDSQENLLRLIIDDPATFGPCIQDTDFLGNDEERIRRYYFTTLWLGFGRVGRELGYFDETDLREEIFKNMFTSPVARELWEIRRSRLVQTYGMLDPFSTAADEEYQKALLSETPPPGETAATND